MRFLILLLSGLLGPVAVLAAASLPVVTPPYYQVRYPAGTNAGALRLGVTYTVWMPPGVKALRGVIVHQHGCGEGACQGGATAAWDWHWQALARKWDCALLGPSYQQAEKDPCQWWSNPREGSDAAFHRALLELGAASGHPELASVPWVLWGHSGGANWAGSMLLLHPERVIAAWLRSGSPRLWSADTNPPAPAIPEAALRVPVMCNLGIKERDDRFAGLWKSTIAFFQEFRGRGGWIGMAIDPRTSHECGFSRSLAIPWVNACLAERLPDHPGQPLRGPSTNQTWLAEPFGTNAMPAEGFAQPTEAAWIPKRAVAAWKDYVSHGWVTDSTPPPAPTKVRLAPGGEITWQAEVDFESGLGGFIIERDGVELARLPEKLGKAERVIFQGISYHDTPLLPLPEMRFTDAAPPLDRIPRYTVTALNGAGMKSSAVEAAR